MLSAVELIEPRTMIPDLLRALPQVRPVLDRYGLHGCGGPLGPMESLHFFAQAHEVPLERLLAELRQQAQASASTASDAPEPAEAALADTIYQPFFKAGIAVVLTLGALWGVYLLLRIALYGSFTAVGVHEVNAHGHAQIFGWVGLFVMGFAYQAFPRFKHTTLAHPRLAYATLGLLLSGLVIRALLEPWADAAAWIRIPAIAASVGEVCAIGLFVFIILRTLIASGKPLAFYDYYILCALGWFVAQSIYETLYFTATIYARGLSELLPLVAVWQAPLRDMQIHGFAMLMIFGVSQRIFHHFYGLRAPHARRSLVCLVALNLAIIGEVLGLLFMRTVGHAWAGLWYGSVLVLFAASAALVWGWRLWEHAEESDRSLKFLRTAYAWLFISLAMLALLPLHQFVLLPHFAPASAAARMGFSHAYYGAIRHAITVGFISLMIVGVAAKVVPTLKGLDVRRLSPLWLPFILLNAGCALRVIGQTLTDFRGGAFPATGLSGLFEVTGLAIWGVHLWRIMNGRVPAEAGAPAPAPTGLGPGTPILPTHLVGEVLDHYPGLLATFLDFGFAPLRNPLLRRTLARTVTIEKACRLHETDAPALLEALNARLMGSGEITKA